MERTHTPTSFARVIAIFAVLLAHPPALSAQTGPALDYGAFVDGAYANSFNDPPNHQFRSGGTTPRVDELDVNMAAADVRKIVSESSRWGVEATLRGGKTRSCLDSQRRRRTLPALTGSGTLVLPMRGTWCRPDAD